MGAKLPRLPIDLRKHCAPLERGSWLKRFYKHLAPLEPVHNVCLLMFEIRKVVNHLKANLVIRRGADRTRPAADPRRRKLAGRRRNPRFAGCHA